MLVRGPSIRTRHQEAAPPPMPSYAWAQPLHGLLDAAVALCTWVPMPPLMRQGLHLQADMLRIALPQRDIFADPSYVLGHTPQAAQHLERDILALLAQATSAETRPVALPAGTGPSVPGLTPKPPAPPPRARAPGPVPPNSHTVSSLWHVPPRVFEAHKISESRLGYQPGSGRGAFALTSLYLGQGALQLTLSSSVAQGGHGKFCYAFTPDGSTFAVKVARWYDKPNLSQRTGRPPTHAMAHADFVDEMRMLAFARGVIDSKTARHARAGASLHGGLDRGRLAPSPLRVFAIGHCAAKQKSYAIMSLEAGDLQRCRGVGSVQERANLALSFAAQGMTELAALHDHAHLAHFDIRPANAVFADQGQIKWIDFGHAEEVNARGQSKLRGPHGSILAPEMVPARAKENKALLPRLTVAVDVFALAISVADLMNAPHAVSPLQNYGDSSSSAAGSKTSDGSAPVATSEAALEAYRHWYSQQTAAPAALPQDPESSATGSGTDLGTDDQAHPSDAVFDTFFAPLKGAAPELYALLLHRALVVDPTLRATASDLAPRLRQMLQASHEALPARRYIAHDPRAVLRQVSNQQSVTQMAEVARIHRKWEAGGIVALPDCPPEGSG